MGGEEIGMAGDPPALVGIDADGATEPLQPEIWWPGLALPRVAQAPWATPSPWLLLVDRRDPRVQAALADLEALLNPEERARRDRFRLAADRHRALLGRGVLRLILGSWLGCDPASLVFQLGPHGKPALVEAGRAVPQFNLAHSGELILLGFHATSPVGVDVEQHRPGLAWEPLARRVLPPAECQLLEQLPPERRLGAFLDAWCRLEARLKARGEGFAGLERLHAEATSGQDSAGERTWQVALPAGYGAAVAVVA
jgi:4'-phosphopantetheinyl transferase